jgi:nucleobase transporter 1/2
MLFCSSGEAIILGFQHYILALGTAVMIPTVLVPMMGGSDVSFPLPFS